jgi:hypothetical protein
MMGGYSADENIQRPEKMKEAERQSEGWLNACERA